MNYVVLEDEEFTAEYRKAFQKQNFETEADKERFRDEVFTVQGAVEDDLKKKWEVGDDFEVGWDFNYCHHTCGGIYSDRIFCKDFVLAIRDALQSVDQDGRWTYHTVCEIEVNPEGKTAAESMEDRGEFFVRDGICYINGATMKREWRARLGCPD
jgi:hypothetical protein